MINWASLKRWGTATMLGNGATVDLHEPGAEDFVQLARLALTRRDADVRMYVSRVVRHYRERNPSMAQQLVELLAAPKSSGTSHSASTGEPRTISAGEDARLSVLREPVSLGPTRMTAPVLAPSLRSELDQLLLERRRASELVDHGLRPASSAVFVGPPGVGKTVTAQWLAHELDLPLLTLDLTAVMSSRLGQSGANLRQALDQARTEPSVLFLDEIDAIAKRRGDEGDVGELKRLVTILLQEIDDWPSTSLLLAATNHPELVDRALWRRFDMNLAFDLPRGAQLNEAIRRFLGDDEELVRFVDVFSTIYEGESFAEIHRSVMSMRKLRLLGKRSADDLVEVALEARIAPLGRSQRLALADQLVSRGTMSQRRVAQVLNVSRDTLRKRAAERD